MAAKVDVLLGNLEDAIQAANKEAARAGPRRDRAGDRLRARPQLWTRVNDLGSPWVPRRPHHPGDRGRRQDRRHHGAEGRGRRRTSTTSTGCSRSSRRRPASAEPLQVHAILETARGVANVEEICAATPRMQGISLGPADLAANRRMKTTRVGGGHPGYLVRAGPARDDDGRATRGRPTSRTCGTTRSRGWSTPARCTASTPTTGRSATSRTPSPARTSSATPTCSAASAPGPCTRSRSTSPRRSSPPSPRGRLGPPGRRRDGRGRHGRGDDRRQDAGRRHVQAVQGRARARRRSWPRATPSSKAL